MGSSSYSVHDLYASRINRALSCSLLFSTGLSQPQQKFQKGNQYFDNEDIQWISGEYYHMVSRCRCRLLRQAVVSRLPPNSIRWRPPSLAKFSLGATTAMDNSDTATRTSTRNR